VTAENASDGEDVPGGAGSSYGTPAAFSSATIARKERPARRRGDDQLLRLEGKRVIDNVGRHFCLGVHDLSRSASDTMPLMTTPCTHVPRRSIFFHCGPRRAQPPAPSRGRAVRRLRGCAAAQQLAAIFAS
jgi:hypothetical protein